MAGEADRAQQDATAASPPVADPPAEESRDVEMADASQPAAAPSLDTAKPEIVEGNPPEVAKEPPQEPPQEAPVTVDAKPEDPKPVDTADEPATATAATEVVDGADKAAELVPENPPADLAGKPADKLDAAEDSSVRTSAAIPENASNGGLDAKAEEEEPRAEPDPKVDNDSPVVGEKRKADEVVEANGDISNKKPNTEVASDTPTTNGSTAPRKPGRPKKEKKAPAPVGKTARRTRSQGAADL